MTQWTTEDDAMLAARLRVEAQEQQREEWQAEDERVTRAFLKWMPAIVMIAIAVFHFGGTR